MKKEAKWMTKAGKRIFFLLVFITTFNVIPSFAQISIRGLVTFNNNQAASDVEVFLSSTNSKTITDQSGKYELLNITPGNYQLTFFKLGFHTRKLDISISTGQYTFNTTLTPLDQLLDQVVISEEELENETLTRLRGVEGVGIYEAKKNEVLLLQDMIANMATNNSRQIYAKVSGLNIWESDEAGLQLGIGARGLDPNRTSNFNVKQNGYDISADALGYPESYYTPPSEAIDRIEIVRGAASLQYGTQFGGLLNFRLREGPKDKALELTLRQTIGSFGFFNSFNSIGGTIGNVNYYGFFQHKMGNGWRPNSAFKVNTGFASVVYSPNEDLDVTFQFTKMGYLAQQPGGLTDALFEQNPNQSIRERNWFKVDWNLAALIFNYKISSKLTLNVKNFLLVGGRDALGNLSRIDRIDNPLDNRDLFVDDFQNIGNETRLKYSYQIGENTSVLVVGTRLYRGITQRKQGLGPSGFDDQFEFNNPDNLEGSDFEFESRNVAVFAENVFNLSEKLSVTPGVRFENINTDADGYFQIERLRANPETGLAETVLEKVIETKSRPRSFLFAGIGISYKNDDNLEFYGNYSQNYRAITFNDIRVVNANLVVNPDIKDEKGFNIDVGVRGKSKKLTYDLSLFLLRYNDRIGQIGLTDENFRLYQYRTNISDSRSLGMELFTEYEFLNTNGRSDSNVDISLFSTISLINAKYINSENSSIANNFVELVPPFALKSGIKFGYNNFDLSYQFSFNKRHFSDASNATLTASAVVGEIPSYYVMDLSIRYKLKRFIFQSGVNNLTNEIYFTRRATGYPGPGIIPSSSRNFYFTVEVKLSDF